MSRVALEDKPWESRVLNELDDDTKEDAFYFFANTMDPPGTHLRRLAESKRAIVVAKKFLEENKLPEPRHAGFSEDAGVCISYGEGTDNKAFIAIYFDGPNHMVAHHVVKHLKWEVGDDQTDQEAVLEEIRTMHACGLL